MRTSSAAELREAMQEVDDMATVLDQDWMHPAFATQKEDWQDKPIEKDLTIADLLKLSEEVWRTRAYGDFWSYMLLAEGSVDVVAEHDLKIYDIAALVPIIEQAGGMLTDFDGGFSESTSSVLATNKVLHKSVIDFLKG